MSLITSTSKNTINDAAIKLNIIVVMTTWLPLVACKYAGINAQAAPKTKAPAIDSSHIIGTGKKLKLIATKKTPRPPI